ncbi:MAG: emrR [Pseudonocardiales bacterium]|nr:emrR [Pseudonocardiales bacterium]
MPTSTARSVEVAEKFLKVYHRMHKVVVEHMGGQAGNGGLTLARTKTLGAINEDGPMRLRAMADRIDCAPASVTDMVDGLERDGLATRQPDPSDRRASLVSITPAGREALAAARITRTEVLDAIFGVLGEEERRAFMSALDTLAASPALNGENS